jgi:hypothetical protein
MFHGRAHKLRHGGARQAAKDDEEKRKNHLKAERERAATELRLPAVPCAFDSLTVCMYESLPVFTWFVYSSHMHTAQTQGT